MNTAALAPVSPRSENPLGGPVVHLDQTGSTNDHARALALGGTPDGTVVIAEEQTAGRGRQGRRWTASRGHALTLSVVIRRDEDALAGMLDLLGLTVAVAVCEAAEAIASVQCRIKWPNDVWIGERKLAGILIESRPRAGWAVIGIGVNVDTPSEELGGELAQSATSLRIESGRPVDRGRALDALLERLETRLREVDRDSDQVLGAYRSRDLLAGREIGWVADGRTLSGEAKGVDEHGRLVVFTREGERLLLDSGEVHLA